MAGATRATYRMPQPERDEDGDELELFSLFRSVSYHERPDWAEGLFLTSLLAASFNDSMSSFNSTTCDITFPFSGSNAINADRATDRMMG